MSDSNSNDACVVERVIDAPVELVWQMWTKAEHFKNWYGPMGFSIPVAEIDAQIGGKHLFCMKSPDGNMTMWSTGEFTELVPNQRLVYTDSPCDAEGNLMSPQAMGMPEGYPTTTEVKVELEDLGGKTKMVLTHTGVPAGAADGWSQAFEKMGALVATL
ncbi:MAG: SRPBCC domain-containing protein [Chloroflexota bacterium]